MAATSTPDTTEVRRKGRQRLIGAVVIVLLAVVFVPMILDPEPRKDRPEVALNEKALAIPSKEGAPPLPAPAAPKSEPKSESKSEPKAEAPAPAAEPAKVEAKPESKAAKPALKSEFGAESKPKAPAPAPAALAAPAPAPAKATPELKGFAVQVGAFRDEEKLKSARDKLIAARIPHFTERLAAGDLTRLRAGPYPTREAAEKAVAGVKLAGLDGKVVPLP